MFFGQSINHLIQWQRRDDLTNRFQLTNCKSIHRQYKCLRSGIQGITLIERKYGVRRMY